MRLKVKFNKEKGFIYLIKKVKRSYHVIKETMITKT